MVPLFEVHEQLRAKAKKWKKQTVLVQSQQMHQYGRGDDGRKALGDRDWVVKKVLNYVETTGWGVGKKSGSNLSPANAHAFLEVYSRLPPTLPKHALYTIITSCF